MISKSTKSILLVDLGVMYGGTSVYLAALHRLLSDKVAFVGLCTSIEAVGLLRDTGMRAYSLSFVSGFGKLAQIVAAVIALLYLKLRFRFDTVWVQGIPDIVLLPLARLLGCNAFVTRHLTTDISNRRWHEAAKRQLAEFVYRRFAGFAQRIFCVSRTVGDDLQCVVPSRRIVIVQNWVSCMPATTNSPRSGERPLRLLFVGRLKKHKGTLLILEAMRRLANDLVSLTIVGEGETLGQLQREAQGLRVRFVGVQRDPSAFYRDADLFIHPTLGPEGLPLTSLEAMSHGLPCILSDLPVHKEITDNGACAVLFRTGDSEDLSDKLNIFLTSPELLVSYGTAGRNMVAMRYSAGAARLRYVEELGL